MRRGGSPREGGLASSILKQFKLLALWVLPLCVGGSAGGAGGGTLLPCSFPLPPVQAPVRSLEGRHHVGFIFVPFISPRAK